MRFMHTRKVFDCLKFRYHKIHTGPLSCQNVVQQDGQSPPFIDVNIPIPWGHIAAKWWGPSKEKPVLALHGWQDNAATFAGLAPLLNCSVLAIDLPGHGKSSWIAPGQVYSFNETVTWIRHVVKYFGWDKMSIVGHSSGSAFGYFYSAFFPDDVEKFVSIDCTRTLLMITEDMVEDMGNIVDKLLELEKKMESTEPPAYLFSDMIELMYTGYGGSLTRESCGTILLRGIKNSKTPHKYHFSRDPRLKLGYFANPSEKHILDAASKIKCEFLGIRGKQGVLMNPVSDKVYKESLKLLEQSCKSFEHHEIEGSHHLHLNNPESVAPLINQFLGS